MSVRNFLATTIAWLFLGGPIGASALAADPTVVVTPIPPTTTTTYPPGSPPAGLPPGEQGETQLSVDVSTNYQGAFDGTTLTITSVDPIDVSGTVSIVLPTDASAGLSSHESGHDTLMRDEYNTNAMQKAQAAFRGFVGMTFTGVGATQAERDASAQAQAQAELDRRETQATNGIISQSTTLNDKYDLLTNHGMSNTESSAQGVTDAIAEFNKAPPAGALPLSPAVSFLPTIATPDSGAVAYNTQTGQLTFNLTNAQIVSSTGGPNDPILGGTAQVGPLQVIGAQANGTIELASTSLSLTVGNSAVLSGFIVGAAYMPSTLPGFAGMIQGYIDIPPASTGAGIDNSIGSEFLDSYQSSFNIASTDSAFWFFTDQPLLGADGDDLALSSGGMMMIGMGQVPEPSSIILLGSGLLALIIALRRTSIKTS